jgi:glycosidase
MTIPTRTRRSLTLLAVLLAIAYATSAPRVAASSDTPATQPPAKRAITGKVVRPPGPSWADHAVFYQIYPQTFYDSNSDGIGDLPGIIEKLDYVKGLGVSAIWLNPFFESAFKDAGYDTTDFYSVAPRYGTNSDAKRLFAEAHKRGLKVLIDYVPSYTGNDHPWFKASAEAKPNKYSNWYVWTNATWFPGMDKYRAGFIQGYSERDGQYLQNFFWHQPALNYGYAKPDPAQPWQLATDHPDVMALKEEMNNVLRFWLDMGADGFRADMAGSLVKNDDGSVTARHWKTIRELLDREYKDKFSIAEWSNPKDALNKAGFHADFLHWFPGYDDLFQKEKTRHSSHDGHSFFDAAGKGDIKAFMDIYLDQYDGSRAAGYISVPFGNHDLIRIRNNGRTDQDLEVIFAFMLTLPGSPFIYYGDEIGMRQLYNLPMIEGCYGGRAGARTPMQWDPTVNKGFSNAAPERLYRAVDRAADAPDVASQEKRSDSLLSKVKALIKLHNVEPALAAYAEFVPVFAEKDTYPVAYVRANGKERLLVVLNPAARNVSAEFDLGYRSGKPTLLGGRGAAALTGQRVKVDLGGVSFAVFRVNAL